MQISIKTVEGKTINLEVDDSSDTIDLKFYGTTRELVLSLGSDLGQETLIRIYVLARKEKVFILDVEKTEAIEDVIAKIHEQGGPPVDKQTLLFRGEQLEKSRTLADYRIENELTLVIQSFEDVIADMFSAFL